MQMSHTGRHQKELDLLEASEGEGVNSLDRIVIDDQHGEMFRPGKCIAR